jgi:protein gp37
MARTSIEWTENTWNPVTGCNKISAGCKFCYAEIMAKRLKAMGVDKYKDGFKVTLQPEALNQPYKWKKSKVIFVNSMSDLFHAEVPFEYIEKVFTVMNDNKQHIFQVLTKRGDVLHEYHERLNWSDNIWMGVSVENMQVLDRIDYLRQTNAKTKFLSCEPLLEALPNLNLTNIDWVIVGGESGRKPRPMQEVWVTDIQQQCEALNVPFFFKQWGGANKKKAGRELHGRLYDEMPLQKSKLELQMA